MQEGFLPDHCECAWHVRAAFPRSLNPGSHWYWATEPNTVRSNRTAPFSGGSSGPQSITEKREKNIEMFFFYNLYIYTTFQWESLDAL